MRRHAPGSPVQGAAPTPKARRRRSQRQRVRGDGPPPPIPAAETVCPLCGRPIPDGARSSLHHLVPRAEGSTHLDTVRLHQICHSAIHARFSEAEIAQRLSDVGSLRQDPELARFLAWVRTKPPGFHARTRRQTRR